MKARLPQGRGGGMGNMQDMLKQAQKMQEDMAALQEELDAKAVSYTHLDVYKRQQTYSSS